MISAQTDKTRNPDGVYSGMTKRIALEDGDFVSIQNMPGDSRNQGKIRAGGDGAEGPLKRRVHREENDLQK
jgi:hypothetical protein